MPELPEVETVRRVLAPQLQGLTVQTVTAHRPEVVAHPDAATFCRVLAGQTIADLARRGKFLRILLDSGDQVVLHLRMTGCLLLTPAACPPEKHTHVVFHLSSGDELRFSDPRRFGRFWLLRQGEPDTYSGVAKLGPEPFDSDLTADDLRQRCARRTRAIKECLLDQSVVAGIGNIYADETLFAAGIHPARPANSLSAAEWARLAAEIPRQLAYFTEKNALSPEEYLQSKGQDYRNTPFLQVYGHGGDACPRCGATLCRMVIGGRSSVYCPTCQPG